MWSNCRVFACVRDRGYTDVNIGELFYHVLTAYSVREMRMFIA